MRPVSTAGEALGALEVGNELLQVGHGAVHAGEAQDHVAVAGQEERGDAEGVRHAEADDRAQTIGTGAGRRAGRRAIAISPSFHGSEARMSGAGR